MLKWIVGVFLMAFGVIMSYDARLIVRKKFSYEKQNKIVRIFKLIGFLLWIIGTMIIILIK